MPYTNYPNGFAQGVTIRGIPLLQTNPGRVRYVGNGPLLSEQQRAGSNGNRGTFLDPFGTLDFAVNSMTIPGRGDIVIVLPNHSETIANATTLTLKNSDVAIIGLGAGDSRPTFNFTTATTANIPVTGEGISIQNCLFTANFADIASVFTGAIALFTGVIVDSVLTTSAVTGTINPGATISGTGVAEDTYILAQLSGTTGGAGTYQVVGTATATSASMKTNVHDFAIDRCEFRDMSSSLNFKVVVTSPANDNAMDGLSMTNSLVYGLGSTAGTDAFRLAGNLDRLLIQGNYITNALAANGVLIGMPTTTKVFTRVLIDNNTIVTVGLDAATGLLILNTSTTNTGVISNNRVNGLRAIASAILTTASSGFHFYDNKYHLTADISGVILPAAQT